MMAEWSASSVQPRCFNTDGIVDYERWAALPGGKHIVVLFYEPDIILTGGWGLVSNILHDEILADDAEWVKPNGQTALWYYTSCSVRSEKETLSL